MEVWSFGKYGAIIFFTKYIPGYDEQRERRTGEMPLTNANNAQKLHIERILASI